MKNVIEYNAVPDQKEFREVDTAELAEIITEIRILEPTATTEAAYENWLTDIDAATRAAELMDAFGETIFVARDEDGFYFATDAQPNS